MSVVSEKQIIEAVNEAVSALYFDDGSDFKPALWDILKILNRDVYDIAVEDLGKAYDILNPEEEELI